MTKFKYYIIQSYLEEIKNIFRDYIVVKWQLQDGYIFIEYEDRRE